mgnify:CR=1 FL=1
MKSNPIFRIITAALAFALVLSCDKDGDKTPAVTSSFKVESAIVNVGESGGIVNVGYSIDGPEAGSMAEVTTETSWLRIGSVTSDNFELEAEPNVSGADRTGKVTLACSGTAALTLHVLQSKESDAVPVHSKYSVSVSGETTYSAAVEITPVDPAAYYYTNIVTKAQYDTYGADGIVSALANQVVYMTSMLPDGTDPHLLLYQGYYNSATDVENELDLNDNTEYYVVVFDMDFDDAGNVLMSGKGEFTKFRTRRASQVDMKFDINVSGASVTVTPSADYTYVCYLASKASWDEYSDHLDVARQYISVAKSYGMLDSIICTGRQVLDLSDMIDNAGEYVFYAVGYRQSGEDRGLTTDISYVTFTYNK